jgi:hypothetical protein
MAVTRRDGARVTVVGTLLSAVALDAVAGAIADASAVLITLGVGIGVACPFALAANGVACGIHGAVVAVAAALDLTGEHALIVAIENLLRWTAGHV